MSPWNVKCHKGIHCICCHPDLVTNSEWFYNSIIEILEDPNEKDEVEHLMTWWNRQIFLLYADSEHMPSKNSALAQIRQKHREIKEKDSDLSRGA
ncbi:hypothetical protein SCLCIDRAFT_28782 [Scleroderma citrinum Foug A]|uniref:Uncharacterized protein n=1 Tax=Scleroderma citrinum Foug A TaxID=1036808 RepID=A0A0C3DNH2_9AGAM|nr:hypothetical protein SCLCIDRAFT_28782 [Scleroderma citrinum Foug A]